MESENINYPKVENEGFNEELIKHKEFYMLHIDDTKPDIFRVMSSHNLRLQSYQMFIRNFMNPSTPYNRLLIKHMTGVGKTLSGLSIAMEFMKYYRYKYYTLSINLPLGKRSQVNLDKLTPNVYILGFSNTQITFYSELMKYPEFGFISHDELSTMDSLQSRLNTGDLNIKIEYEELVRTIKHRITTKAKGGFFKFYGYQEFVYRLFLPKVENLTLVKLEQQAVKEKRLLSDIINDNISKGFLELNKQFLAKFENSLMICDEVHNIYNSLNKNNYGVAIQIVLDLIPSVRAVFLSATPINNSPSEVVDIMNLLLPADLRVKKSDLFDDKHLKENAKEIIRNRFHGRVSFLQDINPKFYPTRIYEGHELKLKQEINGLTVLPYLKFKKCVMPKLHYETLLRFIESYKSEKSPEIVSESSEIESATDKITGSAKRNINAIKDIKDAKDITDVFDDTDDEYNLSIDKYKISIDEYYIRDMVFPSYIPVNENYKGAHIQVNHEKVYGSFSSRTILSNIVNASDVWRKKVGVNINNHLVMGEFLTESNIGTYSGKYYNMITDLIDILKQNGKNEKPEETCPKIMIYHDRVRLSGVLLISEILRANNFIDENSSVLNTTICRLCGQQLKNHTKKMNHEFSPARFTLAHSEITKKTMEENIKHFNSLDNLHGNYIQILVGSKILREGYNVKAVQHMMILSMPVNIPTLIQVFGRVDRKNSHIDLPPDQRNVHMNLYINVFPDNINELSPEEITYADKLYDYRIIQEIEKEINSSAIDADVNYNINFPANTPKESLGNLPFKVNKLPEYKLSDLNLTTYFTYGYNAQEIKSITYIIKKLFENSAVWTYGDLLKNVLNPPFHMEYNTKLISEDNFIVALSNLLKSSINIVDPSLSLSENEQIISKIHDSNDKHIYIFNQETGKYSRYKIEQIDEYYIRFPIDENNDIIKDISSYDIVVKPSVGFSININEYVQVNKSLHNYIIIRDLFIKDNLERDYNDKLFAEFIYKYYLEFYYLFIEDIITYQITGNEVSADSSIDQKAKLKLYEFLSDMFLGLQIMFSYGDLPKSILGKVNLNINKRTPIGYIKEYNAKIFNGNNWFEVNKQQIRENKIWRENNHLIGYLEPINMTIKFKLRNPLHLIKISDDFRSVERGMVCETFNKKRLLDFCHRVDINVSAIKSKNICILLLVRLINLEIKEREKDTTVKYLYLFNEQTPSITK